MFMKQMNHPKNCQILFYKILHLQFYTPKTPKIIQVKT